MAQRKCKYKRKHRLKNGVGVVIVFKGVGGCDLGKAAFRLCLYDAEYRELKQQQRRWLRKRHLKSEFVPLQTLSRLFHLVQFVKCWPIVCDIQKQTLTRFFFKELLAVEWRSRKLKLLQSAWCSVVQVKYPAGV